MTDLCSSLEQSVCFAAILNSLKTNIFFRIWFYFAKNRFQMMTSLHLSRKNSIIYQMTFVKNLCKTLLNIIYIYIYIYVCVCVCVYLIS